MEHEHRGRQYRCTFCLVTADPGDYHIAQLNIATLLAPIDDPSIADFTDNLERINTLGDGSPGFVWRLQTEEGDATALRPYPDPMVIVNMTVWSSVAALKEFAYRTVHADFLARRREWFAAGSTGVVLWWIRAGELPTLDDAKRRLEFLERHGPSPYAFRFARPPAPFVIERTSLEDPDTLDLIAGLNDELTGRYDNPSDNHFRLEPDEVSIGAGAVVVGRLDDRAVACGALRRITKIDGDIDGDIDDAKGRTAEIKRMYVAPAARGNKLGAAVLDRLELEAGALGIDRLVLETGSRQAEAIQLYERAGFTARDPWGPYAAGPHSRCYEKRLDTTAISNDRINNDG
jgi:GNAT superfamily N-acetyltransferase